MLGEFGKYLCLRLCDWLGVNQIKIILLCYKSIWETISDTDKRVNKIYKGRANANLNILTILQSNFFGPIEPLGKKFFMDLFGSLR